jgi:hypothetical protein
MHGWRFLWKSHVQGGVLVRSKRSGKAVPVQRLQKAPFHKEQISITTEIIRYDESVAVVRAVTTTMNRHPEGAVGVETQNQ